MARIRKVAERARACACVCTCPEDASADAAAGGANYRRSRGGHNPRQAHGLGAHPTSQCLGKW